VDLAIILTQTGFCIAYLIFIANNMVSILRTSTRFEWIAGCLPLLFYFSDHCQSSEKKLALIAEYFSPRIKKLLFDLRQHTTKNKKQKGTIKKALRANGLT
jgi:hypothetical protein